MIPASPPPAVIRRAMIWGGSLLIVAFVLLLGYAASAGARLARESDQVLHAFFAHAQQRDYDAAYALMSSGLSADLEVEQLAQQWQSFETEHGALTRWFPVDDGPLSSQKSGQRVCLVPPFVDTTWAIEGEHNSGIIMHLRTAPREGGWKLDRYNMMRPQLLRGLGRGLGQSEH